MIKTCHSVDRTIGNTPLVEICRLNPNSAVRIFAKLEYFNPGGSIKDRVAVYMIDQAEKRGELTRDKVILEATSGNTGIGLALVAAARGYRLCLAMPESASEERKRILKALGAELIFTPASLRTDGAIEVGYNLMREHPEKYFGTDQFNNADNVWAHYHGTGEEIWRQTEGAVTMVVATLGTSGTAMGISRRLKEYNPAIRIVGVEPYLQHRIQGLKNMKESYRPGIYDKSRLDEKVNILDEDAFEMARRLAREEGLLVGMSSGAAMHVAAEKARELEEGVIVVIFPDGGERYLSTDLFADRTQSNLRLYDMAAREKVAFKPLNPAEILMHSCGPTVHEIPHIGHFRRYVVSDLIRRFLEYQGVRVRHVMNIIDLADSSIRGAEAANSDLKTYTEKGTAAFLNGLQRLNIRRDDEYPRASDHFEEMLKLVERLVQKGYAYEKLKSVYFDISKLADYGRLSNIDLHKVTSGTSDLDDYEKDSPVDFTLFKRSNLSELKKGIYFKTRWGSVRPSWHLECAATAMKYLGETFDIHASGADVLFPHCENVLAIGRAATGKRTANYWINTELVMVDGKKMSRSLNNAVTLEELEKGGYHGREIRFLLLGSHYRKPLNFSPGALSTAKNTVKKLDGFVQRLLRMSPGGVGYAETDQLIYDVKQGFTAALDDDINISGAIASLFEFINRVSASLAGGLFTLQEGKRILDAVKAIDAVLGIMNFEEKTIGAEARRLLEERQVLRKQGRWEEADEIRERLTEMGIELSDTQEGVVWRLQ
jgi:cysteinyl-tRNA synthetase